MFCEKLAIITIFCFLYTSSSGVKSSSLNCKRPFYQLIFMNRAKFHTMEKANMTKSCSWLNGCKRQKKMCLKRKGLSQVLWNARKMAVNYCENQFRFDQWNCSFKMKYFKDIYRETAYMQAIAAASLTYSIALACSEGKFQGCKCTERVKNSKNTKWHYNGCGHNIKFAKKLTKKFINIKWNEDELAHLTNYNSEIGLRTVHSNVEKKCKCHGISGSCSIQICWKSLKPFEAISKNLKKMYHGAISVSSTNTLGHAHVENLPRKLVYLKHTTNLCSTTVGRRCNDTDNCATLCCGRGFFVKTIQLIYFCNCGWRDQEVFNGDSLVCEKCIKNQNINICK